MRLLDLDYSIWLNAHEDHTRRLTLFERKLAHMEQDILDLKAAVARVAQDIVAAVAKLSAPQASNADIEAATKALNDAAASLEAVGAPAPAPAPAPASPAV